MFSYFHSLCRYLTKVFLHPDSTFGLEVIGDSNKWPPTKKPLISRPKSYAEYCWLYTWGEVKDVCEPLIITEGARRLLYVIQRPELIIDITFNKYNASISSWINLPNWVPRFWIHVFTSNKNPLPIFLNTLRRHPGSGLSRPILGRSRSPHVIRKPLWLSQLFLCPST
jgi:hypothetical protein